MPWHEKLCFSVNLQLLKWFLDCLPLIRKYIFKYIDNRIVFRYAIAWFDHKRSVTHLTVQQREGHAAKWNPNFLRGSVNYHEFIYDSIITNGFMVINAWINGDHKLTFIKMDIAWKHEISWVGCRMWANFASFTVSESLKLTCQRNEFQIVYVYIFQW